MSETWLDSEKISEAELEGYGLFTIKITHMSKTIENIFECLTVEINFAKGKNVIITYIHVYIEPQEPALKHLQII